MAQALAKGMKSWKTTAAGIVGALMVALPQIQTWLDEDPATSPDWMVVVGAIAVAFGFSMARDSDKSSEDVGAK